MELSSLLRRLDDSLVCELELREDHYLLADHRVRGHRVLPGVACFDLALSAMALCFPRINVRAFEDCVWIRPAVCADETLRLRIRVTEEPNGSFGFETMDDAGSLARGVLKSAETFASPWSTAATVWRQVTESSTTRLNRARIYDAFSTMGIDYGPHFRRIHYADIVKNRAVALLSNNDAARIELCNMLDCAFQSGMVISINEETESLMPFSLGALLIHVPIATLDSHSFYVVTEKVTQFRTNIGIYDENGASVASILDLGVKPSRL
jgi:hypothetical protein